MDYCQKNLILIYILHKRKIMAIYKLKRFASIQENNDLNAYGQQREDNLQKNLQQSQISSRDLQIENMKMQRSLMENQRSRQRLQAEERQQVLKSQTQAQKLEQQKDEQEQKQMIQAKRVRDSKENPALTWGMVKKNTTAKPPIPMK